MKQPKKVRRSTTKIGSASASTTVAGPSLPTQNSNDVFDFGPNDDTPMEGGVRAPIPLPEAGTTNNTMTLAKALELLKTKDNTIAALRSDMKKLQSDCDRKKDLISQLSKQLECLREKERETLTLSDMDDPFVEHNPQHLDKVVADLTCDVLICSPPTKRTKRFRSIPTRLLPTITENTTVEAHVLSETQDSLSFPTAPTTVDSVKKFGLQEENNMLRQRLSLLAATYYHWKVACILSVDRSQQVAKELEKVSKNFVANAPKRENRLTSWALLEEMFPSDMPMLENAEHNQIDWTQNGWDYKNKISSHIEEKQQRLLWPKPASFVLDHTQCPICLDQFGPEGGWALGSCVHVYHPQCLITQCLIRRRCVICSAPFHERLYALFNLKTYMPPSWKHSIDTTPDTRLWGRDLLWSWRQGLHDQDHERISSQQNWETDPEEIVKVALKLMGNGAQHQGRRAFFFQCLGGYFDKSSETFKWGRHPQGYRWNNHGEKVANQDTNATMEELTDMALLDSTYGPYYQSQALDYLLEKHSPQTMRTLKELKDSNVLEAILNADGPASRTRARRRLEVGQSSTYEHGEGSRSQNDPDVIS